MLLGKRPDLKPDREPAKSRSTALLSRAEGGGAKVGPTRGIDIQGRMLGGGQSLMFPLSRVHDCQSGEDQHSQQGSGEGYPVSPFGG